jgi:sugar (pentulose or hexulose) kinase
MHARILAIDAGTTGVRGFVVDGDGRIIGSGWRAAVQRSADWARITEH